MLRVLLCGACGGGKRSERLAAPPHTPLLLQVLGKGGPAERARNLSAVLDGYFKQGGHHINVNVSAPRR